jgi:hypothetical protein
MRVRRLVPLQRVCQFARQEVEERYPPKNGMPKNYAVRLSKPAL